MANECNSSWAVADARDVRWGVGVAGGCSRSMDMESGRGVMKGGSAANPCMGTW